MLAEKLVSIALQRESTDNVTAVVTLFRWPDTMKTVKQWRAACKEETLLTQFKRILTGKTEFSSSESELSERKPNVWVNSDDPSREWIEITEEQEPLWLK